MNINLDTVHLTLIAWQKSVPIFYRFCKPCKWWVSSPDECQWAAAQGRRKVWKSGGGVVNGWARGIILPPPPGLNRVIWFAKIWWGRGPSAPTGLLLLSASLEQEICLYPSMHVIKFDLKDKEQSEKVKLFFVLFWISTAFWTPLTYELWKECQAGKYIKTRFISYWCM